MTIGENMSNETVNQDEKKNVATDSEKNPTVNQDDKQNMIPQARFNDYVAKKNAEIDKLTEKVTAFETQQETFRKKKLEEEGNHKQIIVEQEQKLKDLMEYKETNENLKAKRRDELLDQLSDSEKEIYGELSNSALEKHLLNKNDLVKKTNTDTRIPIRNPEITKKDWTAMDQDERNSNWKSIVSHYKKN